MISNPLARKLSRFVDLDATDQALIAEWFTGEIQLSAGRHITRRGDRRGRIGVLISGWACRYKTLPDGSRQIVAFILPGDLYDVHALAVGTCAHDVVTLTDAVIATVTPEELVNGASTRPNLARALWSSTLVDAEIANEWLLNIGQRPAIMRLAHLLCELWWRSEMVGLATTTSFPMPLTQAELSDALGLTAVHTNRMFRDLRLMDLVAIERRLTIIPNIDKLASICSFEPDYLHITRPQ